MTSEHYFSAQPAASGKRRDIKVTLSGQSFTAVTAPGIFSPEHVDHATAELLNEINAPQGDLLDLGCGWGPIALALALNAAPGSSIYAVDVNERALDLMRDNAASLAKQVKREDMPVVHAGLPEDFVGKTFDEIWSNPPIRIGKEALHDLLEEWLPRLRPGGRAVMVVGKNLGADSLQNWLNQRSAEGAGWGETTRLRSAKGFRILEVRQRPVQ